MVHRVYQVRLVISIQTITLVMAASGDDLGTSPQKFTDMLVLKTVLTPGSGKRGPKPKYHTPDAAKARGVMAGTARPSFDTDSSGHETDSDNADREKVPRSSIKEQQAPPVVPSDSVVRSASQIWTLIF